MGLILLILLFASIPAVVAAVLAWFLADRFNPWLLPLPIVALLIVYFVPHGLHLLKYGDGTDMGQLSGYLEVIFAEVASVLSFVTGVASGYLKRRKVRRA
jgi:hypothetical protein